VLKRIVAGAVALGLLTLYISQFELKEDIKQAKIAQPFAELVPATVKSVTFEAKGAESFSIENAKPESVSSPSSTAKTITDADIAQWGLSGVSGAELDSAALNSLFASLSALTLKDGISAADAGDDKSVYGLSTPELTLKISTNDAAAPSRTVSFGKINDYVNQRYVEIDNDPALYLVPADLFEAASKKRSDFRNKLPLIIFEGDVKELTLSDPQTSYVFEQTDRWKMTAPRQVSVSNSVINEVFRSIRSVRAVDFIDDANLAEKQAQYGLNAPAFSIAVVFKESDKESVKTKPNFSARFGKFTKPDGKKAFAVQRDGSNHIVTFETNIQPKIFKGVNDYREKQLASFDTNDVKSVIIKRPNSSIVITRSTGAAVVPAAGTAPAAVWLVDGKPGDEPFITEYFNTLSTLSAVEFLEDKDAAIFGFTAPYGSVEITLNTGTVRKIIVGAALENSRRAVGVDKLTEPFVVPESSVRKILPVTEILVKAPVSEGSSSSGASGLESEPTPAPGA